MATGNERKAVAAAAIGVALLNKPDQTTLRCFHRCSHGARFASVRGTYSPYRANSLGAITTVTLMISMRDSDTSASSRV